MDFIPLAVATALIWKSVDLMRFIRAKDWQSAWTQIIVWFVGVNVAVLLALSDFGPDIVVADRPLGDLNFASIALFGLGLGSTASAVVDFKKARDNTDSAQVPGLLTGKVANALPPARAPRKRAAPKKAAAAPTVGGG